MVFLALKSSTSQLIERDLAGETKDLLQASAGFRRAASARRRLSRSAPGGAVGVGGAGGWHRTSTDNCCNQWVSDYHFSGFISVQLEIRQSDLEENHIDRLLLFFVQ